MKHKTVAQRFIDEINLTRTKLIQIFDRAIFDELSPNTVFKEEFINQSFKSFITQLVDKKHISSFLQIYDMIIGQINWACESSLGPLAQCDSELYWSNYTLPHDFMNQFKRNGMLSTSFAYPENPGELSIYKPIIWKNKGLTASIVKILNELPEIESIQEEIQRHVNNLVQDIEEEKEPHDDHFSNDNSFNLLDIPSVRSEIIPIESKAPRTTDLERALAEIALLKQQNSAKDLEIARLNQNMVSRESVELIINENKKTIQKVTEESSAKDGVIADKDRTLEQKDKIIEDRDIKLSQQARNIEELHQDKIEELHQDKVDLRELAQAQKQLAQDWKLKAETKDEEKLKFANDLNVKEAKITDLEQLLAQANAHHSSEHPSSDWENVLENVGVPAIGDVIVNIDHA